MPQRKVSRRGDAAARSGTRSGTWVELEMSDSANLQGEVDELVREALSRSYTSVSSDGRLTGNRYQTVDLLESSSKGYRLDRGGIMGRLDFTGLKVLDCGSNLGEISRLARKRGAALVDGIEFDQYFVDIAGLINVLKGIGRVSFKQGDLRDPNIYQEEYDVTLAFSVFPYMVDNIESICAITKRVLILETHDVKDSIYDEYVKPISKHMPFNSVVGLSDIGGDVPKERLIIAFSATETDLHGAGGIIDSSIDLARSEIPFLDSISRRLEDEGSLELRGNIGGFVAKYRPDGGDIFTSLMSGMGYWATFLEGYVDFRSSETLSERNPYVALLTDALTRDSFDPKFLNVLIDKEALFDRVRRRFRDVHVLEANSGSTVDPIRLLRPSLAPRKMRLAEWGGDESWYANDLDGYHRVFASWFFGRSKVGALKALTPEEPLLS